MLTAIALFAAILCAPFVSYAALHLLYREQELEARVGLIAAILNLAIYLVCVCFPYYFQGYSELASPSPGPALGLTALPVFETFAYFFSGVFWSTYWHAASLSMLMLTKGSGEGLWKSSLRITIVVVSLVLISQSHEYEATIGMVLE